MKLKLFKKEIKLRTLLMIAFVILALIFAFGKYVSLQIEYLEYKEIGDNFVNIFWKNIQTKAIIMGVAFVVIFLSFLITNLCINKGIKNICKLENVTYKKLPIKSLSFAIALIASYIFSNYAFETVLSMFNATWFNGVDPIFGKNISYFIFQRPFFMMLVESLSTLVIGLLVYTVAYYIVSLSLLLKDGIDKENFKNSGFITHIFVNIILFLIIRAVGFQLDVENLVFSNFMETEISGKTIALTGAGFVSTTISRYVYSALPYIIGICIIIASVFVRKRKIKKTAITLAIIPAVLILHMIVAGFTNIFIVSPNELDFESKYISYNMEYTKQGYNIVVDKQEYPVNTELTQATIDSNKEIIDNVRITDYISNLKVLNQYQTIKGYYAFNDTDIVNYNIDGKDTAVFVAARELEQDLLQEKNYINRRYVYTHGYGVVVNKINSVDENGYPDFVVKDINTNNTANGIKITEPRIYYGELTDENVVVNANGIKEFDYPNGENENAEYTYKADSGINLTGWNRVLMAIKNIDPQLLYSKYVTNDSKLLINRNIIERVEKVAPFLEYDEDPYIVITDEGKLVWVIDAYTVTNQYPYSQMTEELKTYDNGTKYKVQYNYIRNSVKVLIDAYDGTTKFYIVDRDDPIVMSYNKMYPGLFEENAQIPDDIWKHMRYPEYLFNIQSDILLRYHVDSAEEFYKNEDLWATATHNSGNKEEQMAPYYGITSINNNKQFALMQQYTPHNGKNLIAWTAVNTNKADYGTFKLYTFPKDSNIIGPMQLDNQIDQNADISKDLSLWNSGGSSVTRSMVIVPINNTLLYVEPIYLSAMNEAQIPAVKKIVVSNGSNLAIGNNFDEALKKLVNKETIKIEIEEPQADSQQELIKEIIETNNLVKQAMSKNDWEEYGKQMAELSELINTLETIENK
ncbi:MAG: UPF0182 family protein [Clostridiales bacterium]|nr:UPF0182 family protein [Clostridiales bacterium]